MEKKLRKWAELSLKEKETFNGYEGYCKGEKRSEGLFVKCLEERLERRREKDKKWREKQNGKGY